VDYLKSVPAWKKRQFFLIRIQSIKTRIVSLKHYIQNSYEEYDAKIAGFLDNNRIFLIFFFDPA